MKSTEAMKWIEKQGIVLLSARGPVPNLVEKVIGSKVRGSWWGHPKGSEIYALSETIADSSEILTCKMIEGKVTYVHRRLWPALVRLSDWFHPDQIALVRSVHTSSGKHQLRIVPFPDWVPASVLKKGRAFKRQEAVEQFGSLGKILFSVHKSSHSNQSSA